MKAIVCGGRNFRDATHVWRALDALHSDAPFTLIIHGGATGADDLAGTWAHQHGVAVMVFAADWIRHGRAAGPKRNQRMLTDAAPDLVVAFPGRAGTADMVRRAVSAGVRVVVA